mmetsp:Transcript_34807/g.75902  ORF Transcript_34807/g.75902 Transcript_34807/m.75902 type:complete len:253 (-) Transcript_34807:316-1074(-)
MSQCIASRGAPDFRVEGEQPLAEVAGLREAWPWFAKEVDLIALQLLVQFAHGGAAASGVPWAFREQVSLEGHIPGHEYVQDNPDTPKVRRGRVLPQQSLRRDVAHSAHHMLCLWARRLILLAGVEIDEFDCLLVPRGRRHRLRRVMEHNVLGLDVSVYETLIVNVVHRLQYLAHDPLALSLRHVCGRLKEIKKLATATTLHHDVVHPLVLEDVLQTQHMGVGVQVQHPTQHGSPNRFPSRRKLLRAHLDDDI